MKRKMADPLFGILRFQGIPYTWQKSQKVIFIPGILIIYFLF